MFKSALKLIKHPLKPQNINSKLVSKVRFCFSSFDHERLNQSEFSKELGLEKEYKKVISIEKSNENSSFGISAAGFIIILVIGGGYLFIRVLDNNQVNFIKEKINEMKIGFEFNKEKKEQMRIKLLKDQESNITNTFEKRYKNRSMIDVKFLQYLEDYLEKEIQSLEMKEEGEKFTSLEIVNIIDEIQEKFETISEEKLFNRKEHLLNILEKIVYFQLQSENHHPTQNHQEIIILNFAKFLLKKGNLNHQLLALKYLFTTNPFEPNLKLISMHDVEEIKQRIEINNKKCQESLKIPSKPKKYDANESKKEDEEEKKLYSIKEEIFYSISELKKANEIRKNKINFLNEAISKLTVNNVKK